MNNLNNDDHHAKSSVVQDIRGEFQRKAEEYYQDGIFSPEEKSFLNMLGLEESEANEIYRAIYQKRQDTLDKYQEALITELAKPGNFKVEQRQSLQQFQSYLGISDVEVAKIERKIWAERSSGQQAINTENSSGKSHVEAKEIRNSGIKTIKIFLASSSELKDDRADFERLIGRENKDYIKNGIFLELNMWEDFIDAMSETSLQDEYNKEVQESDIFISLFHTKVGKYTEEEFQKAFQTFKANKKPLIYTYFKNESIPPLEITDDIQTLLSFKKKLKDLGHFCTVYENIHDLENQFRIQLEKIIPNFFSNSSQFTPENNSIFVEKENLVDMMAKSAEKILHLDMDAEDKLRNEVINKQSILEAQQQAINRHINKNNFFMVMKTVKSLAPIIGTVVEMFSGDSSGGYSISAPDNNLGEYISNLGETTPQQEG
jgi:hypothetical protein